MKFLIDDSKDSYIEKNQKRFDSFGDNQLVVMVESDDLPFGIKDSKILSTKENNIASLGL